MAYVSDRLYRWKSCRLGHGFLWIRVKVGRHGSELHGFDGRDVKWVFPKIGVPQNGWFVMENPIKMG